MLWRFDDSGKLISPSSAMALAPNRIAIGDDFNDRVIIVDPTTDQIVREFRAAGGITFKWIDSVDLRPDRTQRDTRSTAQCAVVRRHDGRDVFSLMSPDADV